MKAVIYDKSNAPDVLVLREVEKPAPGDNEVLVKIITTSINAADYRSIKMGIIPKKKIFGADIAGYIEAIGKDTQTFKVGDAVFGDISFAGFGGFAEYVAVPESLLAMKPEGVSFEDAASVPMASVTALQALRDKGKIQRGKRVLIYGAGGGVGTFAVQLAKYFGAEVTAVCSEKKVQLIRSLGADHVINYNQEDVAQNKNKYDLVLAVNGKNSLANYKRLLAPHGVFVVVGGALSQLIKMMLFGAWMSIGNKKMRMLAAKQSLEDLSFIVKLVEDSKIKPVIDRRYSLDETAKAIQYLSEGHAMGKVIISVAQ